jgi:hypothetical protein
MKSKLLNIQHISLVARLTLGALALTGLALAQDQIPRPWRAATDPAPAGSVADQGGPDQAPPPGPNQGPNQGYAVDPQQAPPAGPPDPQQAQQYPPLPNNYGPAIPIAPAQLTIRQGTYAIVRTNQWLSSDRNQQGDTFTATLEQPLVVDGFIVAPRGSTVIGRVSEAKKAGRVEGTSRLGVELTGVTLADGQQVSLQSQMLSHNGPTSVGRDAAAIGGTTALGAAAGAIADAGRGAAIGAGAGAAVGILGVLLTRGRPTVIYPESVMTFQITAPVTIATDKAPQSFLPVNTQQPYPPYISQQRQPGQYPGQYRTAPPPPYGGYGPGYGGYGYPAPYPYAYSYPYPYYGGFGLYVGPGFYRGYRGFRR